MNYEDENILIHYGMPRRSGRYPWGSGDDPYQHGNDFLGRVEELRKKGFTYTDPKTGKTYTGDTAIAKSLNMSTTDFRTEIGLARAERRNLLVKRAQSLKEDGLNPTEIGREMGINESSVRSLLDPKSEERMLQAKGTADFIKSQIDSRGPVEVGGEVNREINISPQMMDKALYILEREGYPVYGARVDQVTNPGKKTTITVACPPGTPSKAVYDPEFLATVQSLKEYISRDGGDTYEKKFTYPESLDSKRLKIRYAEEGGIDKDGIIELRRGVDDLSLGESRYAQVRIMVDGTHYLKGMAVYSDDIPDGVDVVFNTNKKQGTPALGDKSSTVLKNIKNDPDNPFGSLIKDSEQGGQYWYTDKNTGEKKLGLINKTRDESDWTEWKDALPSQFLAKQSLSMAKKQLGLSKADKIDEFNDIKELNNPTIKKYLLNKFADECDSAAVHLKAAALPGQKYHVIIPINSLSDNEVYAPQYEPGTKLALIRYPHGGTFEIPILTVNNKNKDGREIIGTKSIDAVGINKKIADRLSGADFDGDTVMCIPTHDKGGKVKIISTPPLKGLEGFDPKDEYGGTPVKGSDGKDHYYRNGKEYRLMRNTQTEMGIISNLITDMTLAGANDDEKAAAVRHSMVVIDAEKHHLDYKQSELDNNIGALKKKYQVKDDGTYGGASTIISRSKGQQTVEKRQGSGHVNLKGKPWYDPTRPEGAVIYDKADDLYYPVRTYDKKTKEVTLTRTDGKKVTYRVDDEGAKSKYEPIERVDEKTGKVTYTNRDGSISYKVGTRKQKSTKMEETDDAMTLVSSARHPMELLYADYANTMKSLANEARKEVARTNKIEYNSSAKATYQKEYDSLMIKLNDALMNAPRERMAQIKANVTVANKRKEAEQRGEKLSSGDAKKAGTQALKKYRSELGSVSRKKREIDITDREWEAIQAGAISENKLKKILENSNIDKLRERATPKTTTKISQGKIDRIKRMSDSNYTLEQIANKLNLSPSTVSKYLKGVN